MRKTFYQTISPIIWAYRFFGVELVSKQPTFIYRLLNIIHLSIIVYGFYLYPMIRRWSWDVHVLSCNLSYILLYTLFTSTYVVLLVRRKDFVELLFKTNAMILELGTVENAVILSILRPLSIFSVMAPLITVHVMCYLYNFAMGFFHPLGFKADYGINVSTYANYDNKHELHVYRVILVTYLAFFIVNLFILIINMLAIRYVALLMKRPPPDQSFETILKTSRVYLRYHRTLIDIVHTANRCYGEIIMIFTLILMITSILFIRTINIFQNTTDIQYDGLVQGSLVMYYFYLTVIITSNVQSKIYTCLGLLTFMEDACKGEFTYSRKAAALSTKIDLYISHVQLQNPCLTGRGFFSINRSLTISFAATILTYVFVMYDHHGSLKA